MDRKTAQLRKRLAKKTKKGLRGYPLGTLAFYGPDDTRASKVVASIIAGEGESPAFMKKWHDDEEELRHSPLVIEEATAFFEHHGALSVVAIDRIIGCPHEEGIDYEGEACPQCPFWASRDRWTGEVIQ